MNSLELIKIMASHPGICLFAKDLKGRYLYCNDQMAEVAGLDSSEQIVNKKDHDLIWRNQAVTYAAGDHHVMRGNDYSLRTEVQDQVWGPVSVTTTKLCITDALGGLVGVAGCYWRGDSKNQVNCAAFWTENRKFLNIKTRCCEARISRREAMVLYLVILGYSLRIVGLILNISENTAFYHFKNIKRKLNVNSKTELIRNCFVEGLGGLLHEEFSGSFR